MLGYTIGMGVQFVREKDLLSGDVPETQEEIGENPKSNFATWR